jgi:hypothetical protein
MNRLLVVASLVSFTMPFCPQGQHQNVAKLKADARNVVGIIGADKDKTQAYCQTLDLARQSWSVISEDNSIAETSRSRILHAG